MQQLQLQQVQLHIQEVEVVLQVILEVRVLQQVLEVQVVEEHPILTLMLQPVQEQLIQVVVEQVQAQNMIMLLQVQAELAVQEL